MPETHTNRTNTHHRGSSLRAGGSLARHGPVSQAKDRPKCPCSSEISFINNFTADVGTRQSAGVSLNGILRFEDLEITGSSHSNSL
ncbi:uncharacterized protein J3R85_006587 [Psidium guajava]|nr:uncharacterized protein J3R85_006587 [Psidium guajava]